LPVKSQESVGGVSLDIVQLYIRCGKDVPHALHGSHGALRFRQTQLRHRAEGINRADQRYERTDTVSPQTGLQLWRLKNVGVAPVLMQVVAGHVSIHSNHGGQFRGWLLDVNGKRTREIKVPSQVGRIELDLLPEAGFYVELEAAK
jgi:hypothetical protein